MIEQGSSRHLETPGIEYVVHAIRDRWLLVSLLAILAGSAAVALAFVMHPVYRGLTIVAPVDKKNLSSSLMNSVLGSAGGGLASLVGLSGTGDLATEEAVAVLKSKNFTESFIHDKDLLPVLFPKLWDSTAGHWKDGIKKIPTLNKGFAAFDRIRQVNRDAKSGLITVLVDWKDPLLSAQWANELVARLNSEMRTRASKDATESMGYLTKELSNTVDITTREAISRLMENQIKQEMFAHVTEDYALRVVASAIPADVDDPVRPIKTLYGAAGVLLGGFAGASLAVYLRKRKPESVG